ncbi:hypothetical protein PBI_PEREGRIN_10 [Rhodococcus phage Peregrin]|nr:hypothetical protein PBI_PEREGRIN_10 [Rhodococcus phage Peregrin]
MKDNFEQVKKCVLTLEFEDDEIVELLLLLVRAENQRHDRGFDELGIEKSLYKIVDKANDDRSYE